MSKKKRKDIFNQSTRRLGMRITVRTKKATDGPLGHYDPRIGEIAVRDGQPEVAKFVILIHELLHAVDIQLKASGLTKRTLPHAWITHGAPNLLAVLAALDVRIPSWRKVSAFLRGLESAPGAKGRAPKKPARRGRAA